MEYGYPKITKMNLDSRRYSRRGTETRPDIQERERGNAISNFIKKKVQLENTLHSDGNFEFETLDWLKIRLISANKTYFSKHSNFESINNVLDKNMVHRTSSHSRLGSKFIFTAVESAQE